ADDDQVGTLLQPGRLDLFEQAEEQIDVAVDEIEPALLGLAPKPGGDNDHVARGDVAHVAGRDALAAGEAGTVEQVGGRPLGHILVGIDQADTAGDAAALQGVGRHAAHQTAAADDGYFHVVDSDAVSDDSF